MSSLPYALPLPDTQPQRSVTHLLLVAAANAQAALEAVRTGLDLSGGELAGLTLKPRGEIVEASLSVRSLSDDAALRLTANLASRPGVSSARVEHVWGKAS
jgi:hypothetical protein